MNKELISDLNKATEIAIILTQWDSHGDISSSGVLIKVVTPDCDKGRCWEYNDITGEDFDIDSTYAGHRANYRNIINWLIRNNHKFSNYEEVTGWG